MLDYPGFQTAIGLLPIKIENGRKEYNKSAKRAYILTADQT
jgi:hypothetical protein